MAFPLLAIPAAMAGIGALLRGIGKNKPEEVKQIQRFTPQQQDVLNSLLQQYSQGMQQPLGQGFAPIAQQARTQFAEQTVPTIAERFSGMGAGAQKSSAFAQSLGRAGSALEGDLASRQAQFGMGERQLLQNLLQLGLTPQFESLYKPETPGRLSQFGGALQGIGSSAIGPVNQYQMGQQALQSLQGMQGLGGMQQLGGGL